MIEYVHHVRERGAREFPLHYGAMGGLRCPRLQVHAAVLSVHKLLLKRRCN